MVLYGVLSGFIECYRVLRRFTSCFYGCFFLLRVEGCIECVKGFLSKVRPYFLMNNKSQQKH